MPKSRHTILIVPQRGWNSDEVSKLRSYGLSCHTALCHEDDRGMAELLGCNTVTYAGGHLSPCREDLPDILEKLPPADSANVILSCSVPEPQTITALRLMGFQQIRTMGSKSTINIPVAPRRRNVNSVLIKIKGGIGNIILSTPLVEASLSHGWTTYFCPISDLDGSSMVNLFESISRKGLYLVKPMDLSSIEADIICNIEDHDSLTDKDFFHAPFKVGIMGHEPSFSAQFFKNITGLDVDVSKTFIGGNAQSVPENFRDRVVVCPGSKTGWDSKRWPHINELLNKLDNPIVLCREPDLKAYATLPFLKPIEPKNAEIITNMSLEQAAGLLRSASAVIANECGLAHMAAAAGAKTLVFFGPSSEEKNSHLRENVYHLKRNLNCRPCQGNETEFGRLKPFDYHCEFNYKCLADISVEQTLEALSGLL